MSDWFPTFRRLRTHGWPNPWLSTPWWPADSLATKQLSLLRLLRVAVDERLEPAPLIACQAEEHRGRYRRRLFRLAKRLDSGTPLADALEQTPGALSDEQTLAVRFGTQSGTLSDSLQALIDSSDPQRPQVGHRLRQVGFYATFVGVVFLAVLTFIMLFIIPPFVEIMEDFQLDLPEMLGALIDVSRTVGHYGLAFVLAGLFCLWLVKSERVRRFLRRRVLSRVLSPVAQLRSAGLLNLLAVAKESGRPLPGVLSTLARYHYDSLIRHKLLFVYNEVEQGADLWGSMADCRLLSPAESRALESSDPAGTTAWTLERLAEWKQNRVARRFDMLVELLLPVVVLLMGAVVLVTALATLTPLFQLISGLA